MKVFISWSKARSLIVAKALEEWLPQVINQVQPWMSAKSIEAGKLSIAQISEALETTSFGIICVTPENQRETWLNFEAGALSKAVMGANASAVPLLIGFKDFRTLGAPLSNYQAHLASKEDIRTIVHAINAALPTRREVPQLDAAFEKWWPDLEVSIEKAQAWSPPPGQEVTDSPKSLDKSIDEILQLTKTQVLQFNEISSRLSKVEQMAKGREKFIEEMLKATRQEHEYDPLWRLQDPKESELETVLDVINNYLATRPRLAISSAIATDSGTIEVTTVDALDDEEKAAIAAMARPAPKVEWRIEFKVTGGEPGQAPTS
ncbi:UNVERIFIED_ORG: hypothetical protein J2X79_002045 [Arthrobacter globiformis]|nr:hypothetical protein [Arthrobacter globiformis]